MYNVNATLKNFASPQYCEQLDVFLKFSTPFYWRVKEKKSELAARIFDPEELYNNSDGALEEIKIIKIHNAYSVGELESLLPDYCIEKVNNRFRVFCDAAYNIPETESEKLADALAIMAISGLRRRVISIEPLIKRQQ